MSIRPHFKHLSTRPKLFKWPNIDIRRLRVSIGLYNIAERTAPLSRIMPKSLHWLRLRVYMKQHFSYCPCHVTLVIMAVHIHLSRV